MSSLRARLFIALAAVVTVAGLVSSLAIYRWAFGEAIELQDGLIVQVGAFLADRPIRPDLKPSGRVEPDVRVSAVELNGLPAADAPPLAFVSKTLPTVFTRSIFKGSHGESLFRLVRTAPAWRWGSQLNRENRSRAAAPSAPQRFSLR